LQIILQNQTLNHLFQICQPEVATAAKRQSARRKGDDSDQKIPEIRHNDSAIISKISLTLPNHGLRIYPCATQAECRCFLGR
jgi:hypothetical protein